MERVLKQISKKHLNISRKVLTKVVIGTFISWMLNDYSFKKKITKFWKDVFKEYIKIKVLVVKFVIY